MLLFHFYSLAVEAKEQHTHGAKTDVMRKTTHVFTHLLLRLRLGPWILPFALDYLRRHREHGSSGPEPRVELTLAL